jgi:hypothetical protein
MKRLSFLLLISGLTGILALGTIWSPVAYAGKKGKLTVEVAMGDMPSGVNFADVGVPRGIVVLASGNIYPKGTLLPGENLGDPDAPGAIGTWYCHFIHLGLTDSPLIGAVTYFFKLDGKGRKNEESMIIVRGLNSHTPDTIDSVPRVLAVVGGTGKYAGATGEVREEVIGTNNSGSRNLIFEFRLDGKK